MNTEGAKATVNGAPIEGTFSFTEPDKTLGVGNNNVSVTFTPADPTAAEPATGVISVSVAKGDIQVLQTPVITIEYGTRLKNVSLRDFKVETIPASGVSWDWLGADGSLTSLSDPRADQVLAVGTYDDILVRAYTVYNNKYDVTLIPVKVVVNQCPRSSQCFARWMSRAPDHRHRQREFRCEGRRHLYAAQRCVGRGSRHRGQGCSRCGNLPAG